MFAETISNPLAAEPVTDDLWDSVVSERSRKLRDHLIRHKRRLSFMKQIKTNLAIRPRAANVRPYFFSGALRASSFRCIAALAFPLASSTAFSTALTALALLFIFA